MPSTPSVPQISPYGTFQGTLFQYQPFPSLVAFESAPSLPNKCILIGGLSDGLIPTPYTKDLEIACREVGWSLVQPTISSSGLGFGHGMLTRDTDELCTLINYLVHHHQGQGQGEKGKFALVGHSTGCQNAIHVMKYGSKEAMEKIKVIALQAPVSDREDAMTRPTYADNIQHAKTLQDKGLEEEMMPRNTFWAPITAARFLSLQDVGGEDDFFSSDFEDQELCLRLRHIGQRGDQTGLKVLVACSGEDEYVPASVDKNLLLDRLCAAMNNGCSSPDEQAAVPLMLETGNHNLSNNEGDDKETFVKAVKSMLKESLN